MFDRHAKLIQNQNPVSIQRPSQRYMEAGDLSLEHGRRRMVILVNLSAREVLEKLLFVILQSEFVFPDANINSKVSRALLNVLLSRVTFMVEFANCAK